MGRRSIIQDTESSGAAIPTAPGLAGGYPANTNYYLFKRNTDILQRFARRRMPNDIAEVEGQEELLQLRQIDIYQGPSDVYEVAFAAGAGYGDPLERDPEAVRKDVYLEDISLRAAREIFCVVLIGEGEEWRLELRRLLSYAGGRCSSGWGGSPDRMPGHGSRLFARSRSTWIWLTRDGERGSPAPGVANRWGRRRENYKLHCHRIDRQILAANTLIGDPQRFIDDGVQFRQFCRPGCGG